MNMKSVYILVAAIMVLSMAAEMFGIHLHSASWWPLPFGYNIFFGFAGCWLLIIISKIAMAHLLQRDEDYYESRGEEND